MCQYFQMPPPPTLLVLPDSEELLCTLYLDNVFVAFLGWGLHSFGPFENYESCDGDGEQRIN